MGRTPPSKYDMTIDAIKKEYAKFPKVMKILSELTYPKNLLLSRVYSDFHTVSTSGSVPIKILRDGVYKLCASEHTIVSAGKCKRIPTGHRVLWYHHIYQWNDW